jgi:hypothetical protein
MTKAGKWSIGIGLPLLVLVGMQFFPAERTNPPAGTRIEVPEDVSRILERACYDCHSNSTRWPWYSRVAPVSWWLADHVTEARSHLDFTDWPAHDADKAAHKLAEIYDEVAAGEMPLSSYVLLHPGARLSDADRGKILGWASKAAPIPVE